jgi:hypothetical protein
MIGMNFISAVNVAVRILAGAAKRESRDAVFTNFAC